MPMSSSKTVLSTDGWISACSRVCGKLSVAQLDSRVHTDRETGVVPANGSFSASRGKRSQK